MRTKIYQINSKRDVNYVKFEGLDLLERYQGSSSVDPSIYDEVFSAEIDETDLEQIYRRFNTVGHPLHRGHSLSVSDVVVIEKGAVSEAVGEIHIKAAGKTAEKTRFSNLVEYQAKIMDLTEQGVDFEAHDLTGLHIPMNPMPQPGAYYCDVVGFKKIVFDESQTQKPDNLMRVVYVEPHKAPYIAEIAHTLEAEQKAVGYGLIEPNLSHVKEEKSIMATKKTKNKAPAKEQKRSAPNISARIDRLVDYENSKVKAIASVNIGGAFAIHGLRVIDSQKGLFVQMPQNSFQKDGKTEYSDIFHPVTADARTELNSKVLEAYEQKLDEVESENEALDEQDEDAPALGQSM